MEWNQYANKRILVVCSREICYFSGNFFAAQMADAFERLGCDVTRLEFTVEDDLDAILKPLHYANFDLIVDVNSQMCHLEDDDGMVLDLIGGPFYDYIVDHPLFHYNSLHMPVSDMHAIVVDRGQKRYVDEYYPNVKSTVFMPLSANEALEQRKITDRPERILMMSTYVSPQKSYEVVENAPELLMKLQKGIIEIRTQNPYVTNEAALETVLQTQGFGVQRREEIDDRQFALLLNYCYPADTYVRNYFRDKATRALLSAGIPVVAVGDGWYDFQHSKEYLLQIERPCDFSLSYERIAKEHILFNNAPMFPDGMHDRVVGGMANHCAVLTERTPFLEEQFENQKDLLFYDGAHIKALPDIATEMLLNPQLIYDMQEAGYEKYRKAHTWDHRAVQLLEEVYGSQPSTGTVI